MKIISARNKVLRRLAWGFLTGVFSGCGGLQSPPQVTLMEPGTEIPPAFFEAAGSASFAKTFIWKVQCEAEGGGVCAGQAVLPFPSGIEYCRHDYQILEGPSGETAQVITPYSRSSLQVNIQAIGGRWGNPHPSRIVVMVRGIGVRQESAADIRSALHCDPVTFSGNP